MNTPVDLPGRSPIYVRLFLGFLIYGLNSGSSMPEKKTIVDNTEVNVVSLYHFTIYSLQKPAGRGE